MGQYISIGYDNGTEDFECMVGELIEDDTMELVVSGSYSGFNNYCDRLNEIDSEAFRTLTDKPNGIRGSQISDGLIAKLDEAAIAFASMSDESYLHDCYLPYHFKIAEAMKKIAGDRNQILVFN